MTMWWLFYYLLCDATVLIENNKYGCIIMQNDGAMKVEI